MGLFGPSKKERALQEEVAFLKNQLQPEQKEILALQGQIAELSQQKITLEDALNQQRQEIRQRNDAIVQMDKELEYKRGQLLSLTDHTASQEYGLYQPTYEFANSDLYAERLKTVRADQKQCIKDGKACLGNMNWTVNGSASKGKKMVQDMQKLLLRAFNVECDNIVDTVKVSNVERAKERIITTSQQISKLGGMMSISISQRYIDLEMQELLLALDFQQKKQEEKERLRELREQEREEKRVQKEIEEARKKLQKEKTHYQNALDALIKQIQTSGETPELLEKKNNLEAELEDTAKAIANVDYREANRKAGYVYIISNIGAFGQDVYKIGMTRRLEPMDRIEELGDASVPFGFDVHALIFTEDAPALENALHTAFEAHKINKINKRREFFRVSLDEIKTVVRHNFDKTVEWIDVPEAEQYRQSLLMK